MQPEKNNDYKVVASINGFEEGKTVHIIPRKIMQSIKFYSLLEMVAEGKMLPHKLIYRDIIYTNYSEEGTYLSYSNDATDQSLVAEINSLHNENRELTDADILNTELEVLEW